jgi:hypothetical protein
LTASPVVKQGGALLAAQVAREQDDDNPASHQVVDQP